MTTNELRIKIPCGKEVVKTYSEDNELVITLKTKQQPIGFYTLCDRVKNKQLKK